MFFAEVIEIYRKIWFLTGLKWVSNDHFKQFRAMGSVRNEFAASISSSLSPPRPGPAQYHLWCILNFLAWKTVITPSLTLWLTYAASLFYVDQCRRSVVSPWTNSFRDHFRFSYLYYSAFLFNHSGTIKGKQLILEPIWGRSEHWRAQSAQK